MFLFCEAWKIETVSHSFKNCRQPNAPSFCVVCGGPWSGPWSGHSIFFLPVEYLDSNWVSLPPIPSLTLSIYTPSFYNKSKLRGGTILHQSNIPTPGLTLPHQSVHHVSSLLSSPCLTLIPMFHGIPVLTTLHGMWFSCCARNHLLTELLKAIESQIWYKALHQVGDWVQGTHSLLKKSRGRSWPASHLLSSTCPH